MATKLAGGSHTAGSATLYILNDGSQLDVPLPKEVATPASTTSSSRTTNAAPKGGDAGLRQYIEDQKAYIEKLKKKNAGGGGRGSGGGGGRGGGGGGRSVSFSDDVAAPTAGDKRALKGRDSDDVKSLLKKLLGD